MLTQQLTDAAAAVARLLEQRRAKLVLAESCTAGLVAAALGAQPGISHWFCGSAVVYRTATKIAWLDVDSHGFSTPEPDSVGPQTSSSLVAALLAKTPEADIAAAITGHLGPNAPPGLDGRCFGAVGSRRSVCGEPSLEWRFDPTSDDPIRVRRVRQQQSAIGLLELVAEFVRDLRSEN